MWNFTLDLDTPIAISGFALGILAAVLLTAYNIPTAVKIARRKDGTIVSLKSLAAQYCLQIVTLAYGILEQQVPLIVSNVAGLLVLTSVAILRKKYWIDKPSPRVADLTYPSLDAPHSAEESQSTDHPALKVAPEASAVATDGVP
jgi:uncharacterized protein with PQ loop repeat